MFLITNSVSLLVISLSIFSIFSWFSLGRLYVSRNLFISSTFKFIHLLLFIVVPMNFSISMVLVVLAYLHFWFYLFESSLFSFWWVTLKLCWFYLFKEPALSSTGLFYCLFRLYFNYLCSDLYFLPFINLELFFLVPSAIKWLFDIFLVSWAFISMNFLRTAFAASYKFWYVVFPFLFVSKTFNFFFFWFLLWLLC